MAGHHDQKTNSSNECGRGGNDRGTRCLGWVKKEKKKKYGNKNEVGPDTAKPISIELGGRMGIQTNGILQGMATKLAEARGGELNAATALRKMKLAIERTLLRSEADAINATNAYESDQATRTRRDGEGGW